MAKKPLSEAQKAALAKGRAARDANRQNKNPQNQNTPVPEQPAQAPAATNQLITLTQDQFDSLIGRLTGSGTAIDRAPGISLQPSGMQTNAFGQVVGTIEKFNPDVNYYPDPTEQIYDDFDANNRTRRINLRDNYWLLWEITSKPYETKDHTSMVEPTFHMTLYQYQYDDEGEQLDDMIARQTLHLNEDEILVNNFAQEQGIKLTAENMRDLMDQTRYARIYQWLLNYFFPPRIFKPTSNFAEQAIDGQAVKVVTKSSVKGIDSAPKFDEDELRN